MNRLQFSCKAKSEASSHVAPKVAGVATVVGLTALAALKLPAAFERQSVKDGGPADSATALLDSERNRSAFLDAEPASSAVMSLEPSLGKKWAVSPKRLEVSASVQGVQWVRLVLYGKDEPMPVSWHLDERELIVPVKANREDILELVLIDGQGAVRLLTPRAIDDSSCLFAAGSLQGVTALGVQKAEPGDLPRIMQAKFAEAQMAGIRILPHGENRAPFLFELEDKDGAIISQRSLQGKVIVFFEWATWCTQCHIVMPELFELAQTYPGKIALVGICHDLPETAGKALAEMQGFPPGCINVALFKLAAKHGPEVYTLWSEARSGSRLYGIPRTLIVGGDGVFRGEYRTAAPDLIREAIQSAVVDKEYEDLPPLMQELLKTGTKQLKKDMPLGEACQRAGDWLTAKLKALILGT